METDARPIPVCYHNAFTCLKSNDVRGESQGATPSMNPANLGLCLHVHRYYKRVRRALSFGSLLPPTPLHKGQNVHFVYEAIPKLDIYFLYLYLQHIDIVFCMVWACMGRRGACRDRGGCARERGLIESRALSRCTYTRTPTQPSSTR